ncbi:MAG: biopolymer transporter ExbD [Sandaracinaceae bacterium]|nr:biopolymer transporter ExbD [Sandaracinaceae bacterium]MDW8246387.1 biopolymer transporter ExbD [Sandaracinaceae bacterium]
MAQVKAIIRRKLRRHPEHTEEALNIYPMMDMMTILLVFLIMQFSQDTANVVQSDDLQLPYTISREDLTDALPVQITRTDIIVDGRRVTGLRNGIVDPSQKQGGATGFLITPLHTIMLQHRDRLKLIASRNPKRPFRGAVQIIADRRTPFRTIAEVIYTLGQAEFSELHFVALQGASLQPEGKLASQ